MKTLKILTALTFALGFIFNNATAQVGKIVVTYNYPDFPVNVPCLEDPDLVGSATVTIFEISNGKYVNKWEGVVYDDWGNEYTMTNKEHYFWSDVFSSPLDGGNVLQLRRGGKLVALIHANFNYKIENGVPYLQSGGSWVECR